MSQAQSTHSNLPETEFNLLEDAEDADNHTSDSTATRLSLQFQLDEQPFRTTHRPVASHHLE